MHYAILTAFCLIGSLDRPSSPGPAELAARFDRLERRFASYQMSCQTRIIQGGAVGPTVDSELIVDGLQRKQYAIHYGPRYATQDLARRYDGLLNGVVVNREARIAIHDKSREVEISSLPILPPTGFHLIDHTEKLFLTSALIRPSIDRPVTIDTPAGKSFRCTWRDLILPDALRQPGWSPVSPGEGSSDGLLGIRRLVGPDFQDTLWLAADKGYALARREFQLGGDCKLVFEYTDITQVGDGIWMAMACRWRRDNLLLEPRVTSLEFGPARPGSFEPTFLPGSKIIDHRSGDTTFLEGGEDMLAEMVERFRYLYSQNSSIYWYYQNIWMCMSVMFVLPLILLRIQSSRRRPAGFKVVRPRTRHAAGFTLIEILVAIGIIGLLVALLLPAVQSARQASLRMQCSNNLRQIGSAIHQYSTVHQQFPSGRPSRLFSDNDVSFGQSVFVSVLPFLEGQNAFNIYNFSYPAITLVNLTASMGRPNTLFCPSDPETAPIADGGPGSLHPDPDPPGGTWPTVLTSYALMYGDLIYAWESRPDPQYDPYGQINGSFNDRQSITPAGFMDGLSNTAFASERALGYINRGRINPIGQWIGSLGPSTLLFATLPPNSILKFPAGDNAQITPRIASVSSFHIGGINVLMGDGSTRFVKETISSWPIDPVSLRPVGAVNIGDGYAGVPQPGVWQSLTTRSGGEIISDF